jgi:LmbE family N-acetylglucosaminyl deacetylase
MIFKPSKVLVVAPHTDDMELCCGGTVARLVLGGAKVDCMALSLASHIRPEVVQQESQTAAKMLGVRLVWKAPPYEVRYLGEDRQGILEHLLEYRRICKYDMVIGPSTRDTHQDHEVVAKEVFRAFKDTTILAWEAPWNNITSELDLFVSLDEKSMVRKLNAVRCYDSQKTAGREYFTEEYIRGWARMRGGQVGHQYAEAFEIVRMKL